MYGCDNFCTYCIVPYVRGRERSRKPADIISEIEESVAQGYKEIFLLGQNVNSYGKGGDTDFAGLLSLADKVPGVCRIRFMTSHPKDLGEGVIEAIRESSHICEHIHLPIQHGSDRILKAMNRQYTAEEYLLLADRIRRALPNVSLTTDLIVGFPGETEEDFGETLELLEKIRFDAAYTFIYSKRSGTPAAKMENQIEESLKRERLQRLMQVQNKISLEINEKLKGTLQEVLVEGPSKTEPSVYTGKTPTDKTVLFPHGDEKPGDMVTIRITQPQTWVLKGESVE